MYTFNFVKFVSVLFFLNASTWCDNRRNNDTLDEIPGPVQKSYLETYKVVPITAPLQHGEGPHWDLKQQALYFVDIPDHSIHRYDPVSQTHTKTRLGDEVSFIIPVHGTADQFVVGVGKQFQVIRWDGRDRSPAQLVRVLADVDRGLPTITNDAKCDPAGRLFAGTIGIQISPIAFVMHKSSLYRLEGDIIKKLVSNITVSNGMAWDVGAGAYYYTDSEDRKIRRYDYDVETGDISSNFEFVFDFENNDKLKAPDGFTIDTDGNLWIATYAGSCIINVDPRTGVLLRKVPIPAQQVTSVTIGGPDLDIIFVTTAQTPGTVHLSTSGSTFMVTGLDIRGYPNVEFKL